MRDPSPLDLAYARGRIAGHVPWDAPVPVDLRGEEIAAWRRGMMAEVARPSVGAEVEAMLRARRFENAK